MPASPIVPSDSGRGPNRHRAVDLKVPLNLLDSLPAITPTTRRGTGVLFSWGSGIVGDTPCLLREGERDMSLRHRVSKRASIAGARDGSGTPDGVGSRPRAKGRQVDTPRPQHSPYREQVGQRPVVERLHVTTKSTFDLGQLRGVAPTSVTHHAAVALADNEHGSQLPSRNMAPGPFPLRSPRNP